MDGPVRLQVVLCLGTLGILVGCAYSLEYYEFRHGADASVTFNVEMQEGSVYSSEIFTLNDDRPFYTGEQVVQESLHPSQVGRLDVETRRKGNLLAVTLDIREVKESDAGVYILSVREDGPRSRSTIVDAYVDVILPPGRANCTVVPSSYSDDWLEVRCSATAGSDGGGFLACYQDGKKAAFLEPVDRSEAALTATFWMQIQMSTSINCCSFEANYEKDPAQCTDFTHHLPASSSPKVDNDMHIVTPSKSDSEYYVSYVTSGAREVNKMYSIFIIATICIYALTIMYL